MTFNWASMLSLATLIILALGLYVAKDWSVQAGLFPLAIGIPALLLTLYQFVMDIVPGQKAATPEDSAILVDLPVDKDVAVSVVVRRAGISFGWIFGLTFAIWALGFLIAVPSFIFLYILFQAGERWWIATVTAFLMGLFQYVLFDRIIHTNWPEGAIQQWIG